MRIIKSLLLTIIVISALVGIATIEWYYQIPLIVVLIPNMVIGTVSGIFLAYTIIVKIWQL